MMYKANVAVCSEIHTKRQCKSRITSNVLMLNPVVRKETATL